MAFKQPVINAQVMKQQGMARPGGMASRGSTAVPGSRGKSFAAMENALLKSKKPSAKKLAPQNQPGRQYFTSASGGSGGMKPKSDTDKTMGKAVSGPAVNMLKAKQY